MGKTENIVNLNHSSILQEIKGRAEKLAAEVKERLTQEEKDAAQAFAENASFESVVKLVLEQAKKPAGSNIG